jgi:hypothetical protein
MMMKRIKETGAIAHQENALPSTPRKAKNPKK